MSEMVSKQLRDSAWLRSAPLAAVFAALKSGGADVRAVGGAVRDTLLSRPVKEIDLATTALPDEVMRLAAAAGFGVHPTGIEHGTVTVVVESRPFEITTLRRDVRTDGRRAVVAFSQSWDEDAARRDFTINALYCDLDGKVYDFAGGLEDLRKHRVRFIGDPASRIREDYLRILRFFRFSAEHGGGNLDTTGLVAAVELKAGIERLSPERIRNELLKLLAAPKAVEVIRVMDAKAILPLILPGPSEPQCLARLVDIEAALGEHPDVIARLAVLATNTPEKAEAVATRLRLSNTEAALLTAASAAEAAADPQASDMAARAALYRLGAETFRRAVRVAWARSAAPTSDPRWRARALLADRWRAPRTPFTGADIVALGVPAGPAVGRVLKSFEGWWITNDFPTDPGLQRQELERLVMESRG